MPSQGSASDGQWTKALRIGSQTEKKVTFVFNHLPKGL